MLKKKELLNLANDEFPGYYYEKQKHDKEMTFKKDHKFPRVEQLYISNVKYKEEKNEKEDLNYDFADEIEEVLERLPENFIKGVDIKPESETITVVLVIQTRKKVEFVIMGYCYGDTRGEDCNFFDIELISKGLKQRYYIPRNMKSFARYFTVFFLFDFLKRKEININEWNYWDDIVDKHYS